MVAARRSPPKSAAKRSIVATDELAGFDKIFEFFRERLAAGELRAGQRLLPERELAQYLGVSRGSLREVMRVMVLLGVIEIRPGQGAFVTAPNASVLRNFFGVLLMMQPTLYEHILEARIAIECQAARLACESARKPDLDRLRGALAEVERTIADESAGADADFEFHNALVCASHNEVIRFIHEAIETLLRRSHHERRHAVSTMPGFLATLGDAHRSIVGAIEAGDPDQAERIVREHFTIAQDYASPESRRPSERATVTMPAKG